MTPETLPITPLVAAVLVALAAGQSNDARPAQPPPPAVPTDGEREAAFLRAPVQLTFPSQFAKAGEAYFSPDDRRVIFQAVEKAAEGTTPADFYAMYVADVVREGDAITGLANVRRLSPPGSANTCGWFDPTDPYTVLFASTVGAPTESEPPGFQRGTGRYRWMFPPEMRIVLADLKKADGSAESLRTLVGDGTAYVAEGSMSPDGRWVIYCDLSANQGDLYVFDRLSNERTAVVSAPGYDGGPFFAPDGKRIVYRSDRNGDNHLQVFVADLAFDERGRITGIAQERQVTRDANVNWAPFFHPSGEFLVFASSAVGHRNYEVFAVDAGTVLRDGIPQARYGTNLRRVTHADGADVLPVFSHDGKHLLWTGQRGEDRSSQLYVAEWVAPRDPVVSPGR